MRDCSRPLILLGRPTQLDIIPIGWTRPHGGAQELFINLVDRNKNRRWQPAIVRTPLELTIMGSYAPPFYADNLEIDKDICTKDNWRSTAEY